MKLVLLVLVWAAVLGLSPGLTLIAVALTALALDRVDRGILDRLLARVGAGRG